MVKHFYWEPNGYPGGQAKKIEIYFFKILFYKKIPQLVVSTIFIQEKR